MFDYDMYIICEAYCVARRRDNPAEVCSDCDTPIYTANQQHIGNLASDSAAVYEHSMLAIVSKGSVNQVTTHRRQDEDFQQKISLVLSAK